jgi:CRP-like cAMP-binding protein/Ca2+-binding EF-hand superfamily protein
LFRRRFEVFDADGGGTIDANEMETLLRAFGDSFEERDLRHAMSFLDENSEMDVDMFVEMMHALSLRKRAAQLAEEKANQEKQYLETFHHFAVSERTINRRTMTLGLNKLNIPISKRGARVLLRTVRLIDDSDQSSELTAQELENLFPKSLPDQHAIMHELSRHFLFRNLSAKYRHDAMMAMRPRSFRAGEVVICEGDDGTEFFVLLRGICDVFVDGVGRVFTYNSSGVDKKQENVNAFGELALVHKAPRSATVQCRTDCELYVLGLREFRRVQSKQQKEDGSHAEAEEKRMRTNTAKKKKRKKRKKKRQRVAKFVRRKGSRIFGSIENNRKDQKKDSGSLESTLEEVRKEWNEDDADGSDTDEDVDFDDLEELSIAAPDPSESAISPIHSRRIADEESGGIPEESSDDGRPGQRMRKRTPRRPNILIRYCGNKWTKMWRAKTRKEIDVLDERDQVTFLEFRRLISLAVMQKAIHWPETKYRKDFVNMFEDGPSGCVAVNTKSLKAILEANHIFIDDIDLQNMVYEVDRGDGKMLFDDFMMLMHRFHPEDVERRLMDKLHDKGIRLTKELRLIINRILMFPFYVIFALLLNLFKLCLNIYLVASSLKGPKFVDDDLTEIVAAITGGIMIVSDLIPGLDLSILADVPNLGFGFLSIFTFDISLKGGVTCVGMQAPLFIFISYTIVASVVLLFDSTLYVFLKVAPMHYKHQKSVFLHRSLPILKSEKARFIEEKYILGMVIAAERSVKNLFQILISKITILQFTSPTNPLARGFPFMWGGQHGVNGSGFTLACEKTYPGSERVSVFVSSIGFWLLMPACVHVLTNAFIYALAPPQIDKDYKRPFGDNPKEEEVPLEEIRDYQLSPSGGDHELMAIDTSAGWGLEDPWKKIKTARIPSSYRNGNNENKNVRLYGYDLGEYSWMSILKRAGLHDWFEDSILDNPDHKERLFLHDPLFWQRPRRWFKYFVRYQADGDIIKGIIKYARTMLWKGHYLVKLSFGVWDETLIESMQIKSRANLFDLNRRDTDLRHEDLLIATGEAHTLFWQFIPYCVFLSKGGEAFNQAPIFVYDNTAERTIQDALERHGKRQTKIFPVKSRSLYPDEVIAASDEVPVDEVVEKIEGTVDIINNCRPSLDSWKVGGGADEEAFHVTDVLDVGRVFEGKRLHTNETVSGEIKVEEVVDGFESTVDIVVDKGGFVQQRSELDEAADTTVPYISAPLSDMFGILDSEPDKEVDVKASDIVHHIGAVTMFDEVGEPIRNEGDVNIFGASASSEARNRLFGAPAVAVTDDPGEEQKETLDVDHDSIDQSQPDVSDNDRIKSVFTLDIKDGANTLYDELDRDIADTASGWYIQVQRPVGCRTPKRMEGMFIWFDEDSVIGNITKADGDGAGEEIGAEQHAPYLTIFQCTDEEASHGKKLNPRHLDWLFGSKARVNPVNYGDTKLRGRVGNKLPSREKPLYVACRSCIVRMMSSGNSGSHARIRAVYAKEPPLLLETTPNRLKLRWLGNILSYGCLMAIVIYQREEAFAIWLGVAILLAVDQAEQDYETNMAQQRDKRREESLLSDPEAWDELWRHLRGKKKSYRHANEDDQAQHVLEVCADATKSFEYLHKRTKKFEQMQKMQNHLEDQLSSQWDTMPKSLRRDIHRIDDQFRAVLSIAMMMPFRDEVQRAARHAGYCRIILSTMQQKFTAAKEVAATGNTTSHVHDDRLFKELYKVPKQRRRNKKESWHIDGDTDDDDDDDDDDDKDSGDNDASTDGLAGQLSIYLPDGVDAEFAPLAGSDEAEVPVEIHDDLRRFDEAVQGYSMLLRSRDATWLRPRRADVSHLTEKEANDMFKVEVALRELSDKGAHLFDVIESRIKRGFPSGYLGKCLNDHPLIEMSCPYEATCDMCGKAQKLHAHAHRCGVCMYDVCDGCFGDIKGQDLRRIDRLFDNQRTSMSLSPFQTLKVGHTSRSRALLHMTHFHITFKARLESHGSVFDEEEKEDLVQVGDYQNADDAMNGIYSPVEEEKEEIPQEKIEDVSVSIVNSVDQDGASESDSTAEDSLRTKYEYDFTSLDDLTESTTSISRTATRRQKRRRRRRRENMAAKDNTDNTSSIHTVQWIPNGASDDSSSVQVWQENPMLHRGDETSSIHTDDMTVQFLPVDNSDDSDDGISVQVWQENPMLHGVRANQVINVPEAQLNIGIDEMYSSAPVASSEVLHVQVEMNKVVENMDASDRALRDQTGAGATASEDGRGINIVQDFDVVGLSPDQTNHERVSGGSGESGGSRDDTMQLQEDEAQASFDHTSHDGMTAISTLSSTEVTTRFRSRQKRRRRNEKEKADRLGIATTENNGDAAAGDLKDDECTSKSWVQQFVGGLQPEEIRHIENTESQQQDHEGNYAERLDRFYAIKVPEKRIQVASTLQKWRGHEGALFAALEAKYGSLENRDRDIDFYAAKASEKREFAFSTLKKWKGHEDELFEALEAKYGALDESEATVDGTEKDALLLEVLISAPSTSPDALPEDVRETEKGADTPHDPKGTVLASVATAHDHGGAGGADIVTNIANGNYGEGIASAEHSDDTSGKPLSQDEVARNSTPVTKSEDDGRKKAPVPIPIRSHEF